MYLSLYQELWSSLQPCTLIQVYIQSLITKLLTSPSSWSKVPRVLLTLIKLQFEKMKQLRQILYGLLISRYFPRGKNLISDQRLELFREKYILWLKQEPYTAKNATFQHYRSIFQGHVYHFCQMFQRARLFQTLEYIFKITIFFPCLFLNLHTLNCLNILCLFLHLQMYDACTFGCLFVRLFLSTHDQMILITFVDQFFQTCMPLPLQKS